MKMSYLAHEVELSKRHEEMNSTAASAAAVAQGPTLFMYCRLGAATAQVRTVLGSCSVYILPPPLVPPLKASKINSPTYCFCFLIRAPAHVSPGTLPHMLRPWDPWATTLPPTTQRLSASSRRRVSVRLGLRTTLLQQMENQLEDQTNEKKLQAVEFESANERNASLLKDLEVAEENLRSGAHIHLHPTVIALETRYWASIEEQLPKWEQFLLGQTKSPVEVRNPKHKKSQKEAPRDKVTIKNTNLPPSASAFKTPPQSPHSEKQKRTKAHKK